MRRTTPKLHPALLALAIAALATALSAAAAPAKAWLGVYSQEVTADLRSGLDLREGDDGVLIARVVAGSPAEKAGLRKGDLVVKLDAHVVDSPDVLARLVGEHREGEVVAVEVLRRGERKTISVTLAARPASADEAPSWTPRADVDDGGDADAPDAPGARERKRVRVRIETPDGEPRVYRFDGSGPLPGEVHRMLRDLHVQDLGDGGGTRRIVIRTGGRARLGVRIEPLGADMAAALGAPSGEGVLVMEVMKDTPAERAGLKPGDVITAVGGTAVKGPEDLQKSLRDVDGKASLSVLRKGTRRTVEADLGHPAAGREEGSLDGGRMEGLDRFMRLRDRSDADEDGLRKDLDELRKELRDLRRQLEEQKDQHH